MITNETSDFFEGRVIFWNGFYGFIQESNSNNIFFHNSSLGEPGDKYKIKVFYTVRFKKAITDNPKHFGKTYATDVTIIKTNKIYASNKDVFKEIELYVGIISSWDESLGSGSIDNTHLESSIRLYESRNLFKKTRFKTGDIVVFNPVKFSEHNPELFAFIAYHARYEKSHDFLKSQAHECHDMSLRKSILEIIYPLTHEKTIDEEFETDLILMGYAENEVDRHDLLVTLIMRFRANNYIPKLSLLKMYYPDYLLIMLWTNKVIDEYDETLLYQYFYGSSADTKRVISHRLSENKRSELLGRYFKDLKDSYKLERLSNHVKLLLDLTYRNEQARCIDLYLTIKDYLIAKLSAGELINLWLNDYIDSLTNDFLKENFDKNEQEIVSKLNKTKDYSTQRLIESLYEDYFMGFDAACFDVELPRLVKRLLNYQEIFNSLSENIEKVLNTKLHDYQLLILWIFNVKVRLDPNNEIEKHTTILNDYYKIRFHFRCEETNCMPDNIVKTHLNITKDGIINFIKSYEWNDLVHPGIKNYLNNSINCFSFLDDVRKYFEESAKTPIDIKEIAECIFHSIKKYTVSHLRLWLDYGIDNVLFDYVGFRSSFKDLSSNEQYRFKKKASSYLFLDRVINVESSQVNPCKIILEENPPIRKYQAFIENIYFGRGYIKLRMDNDEYTNEFSEGMDEVSSGFNRIPVEDKLNKMPIDIEVNINDNNIIEVSGVYEIIITIQKDIIKRALGTVIEGYPIDTIGRQEYAEDLELRKIILNYLFANHSRTMKIETVKEPRNFFRRLDENSEADTYDLTSLFTFETNDGLAIIWEDIDINLNKATYIFKTTNQDYSEVIHLIIEAITTFAQLRSALSNNRDRSEEMNIFKRKYGFVASIRKDRGDKEAFVKWEKRLKEKISLSPPLRPSDEELTIIENWKPYNPHKSSGVRNPGIRPPGSIPIDTTGLSPQGKQISYNDYSELLNTLRKYNNKFLIGLRN